jgi:decaprenyl-phosphate phosphoribosyltransferase
MNIKNLIRLLRPKHYLKNLLIFLPLIFSGNLFNQPYLVKAVLSFLVFSMVASAVYIINDLRDREYDAKHPSKKNRPIASGAVSVPAAIAVLAVLLVSAALLQYYVNPSVAPVALLATYLLINVLYSFGLKNIPIVDVTILSVGFVIRVLYGGSSEGIEVSKWLYLAVLAFSFYLGLGKRRNELLRNGAETRRVNRLYSHGFLDKNMYVFLGLTITYYSLWAIEPAQLQRSLYISIPFVIAIVMAYSLAIETGDSDGDPVSVVLSKNYLVWLIAAYGLLMLWLVYFLR